MEWKDLATNYQNSQHFKKGIPRLGKHTTINGCGG